LKWLVLLKYNWGLKMRQYNYHSAAEEKYLAKGVQILFEENGP
jgi:hypothetical protein